MGYGRVYVQTKADDGVFRTAENGDHKGIATAFEHYTRLCTEQPDAVHKLMRRGHTMLRSDAVELADKPVDALL